MAWSTNITVADVRAECRFITAALKVDAVVQSAIDQAKAWIEGTLRAFGYDPSDPSLDKSVWLTGLGMACYILLEQIYGDEGWEEEAKGMAREYHGRFKFLVTGLTEGTFIPYIPVVHEVPEPLAFRPEYEDPDDPIMWPFELRDNIDDAS